MKKRVDSPWYNNDIRTQKKERRRLERQWRRSKLQTHRELFNAQRDLVNHLVKMAKCSHYVGLVEDCHDDSKKLFSLANRLLNRRQSSPLPSHSDSSQMASSFLNFFQAKVKTICDSLAPDESPHRLLTSSSFDTIQPTSPEEITLLLRKLPPKSCQLDPIPTKLLKECPSSIAPILSHLVNLSIDQAYVPPSLKVAYITPLLKKPSLDHNSLQNYRPVSNLPFLFKILERIVFSRLSEYLSANDLLDPFQSGYKPNHSVETLLVDVSNHILQGMDKGKSTALLLLDLSSAFDTVNHTILLNTLSSLGIKGDAFRWFQSYLAFHSQIVCINGCKSEALPLTCGVPQGSVGGPTLFSIYLIGLRQVLLRHGIKYHIYADDIQLMISFDSNQVAAENAIQRLECCMVDIHNWLTLHSLKLNSAKCEFLIFGSKIKLSKIHVNSVSFSGLTVNLSNSCRNLGIIFDSNMTMTNHISFVCKSVHYQLRNIGFIRKYLSQTATEKLVHALISSRLDFGNALLFNLPQNQLFKLQKLQNAAARIVSLSTRRTHITPILRSLHWLPVKQRIIFKILLLTFHCMRSSSPPQYLISLINRYTPSRPLRSFTSNSLVPPKVSKTWGERSFAYSSANSWNTLPEVIKNCITSDTFKMHLKTHLFNLSFPL